MLHLYFEAWDCGPPVHVSSQSPAAICDRSPSEKIIIQSDSQLVVGQVNREYETRDQCMAKYVCLVKLQLESFVAWKLKHILRGSNKKANALVAIAASLPTKGTVLLHVYY